VGSDWRLIHLTILFGWLNGLFSLKRARKWCSNSVWWLVANCWGGKTSFWIGSTFVITRKSYLIAMKVWWMYRPKFYLSLKTTRCKRVFHHLWTLTMNKGAKNIGEWLLKSSRKGIMIGLETVAVILTPVLKMILINSLIILMNKKTIRMRNKWSMMASQIEQHRLLRDIDIYIYNKLAWIQTSVYADDDIYCFECFILGCYIIMINYLLVVDCLFEYWWLDCDYGSDLVIM